jgi:hypothetical protein
MRLIDANDAIERLQKAEAKMHTINGVKAVGIGSVISFLQRQFVVDAVPVVRCKDCKHYEAPEKGIFENCMRDGQIVHMYPDDFCSYGERRTDGKD